MPKDMKYTRHDALTPAGAKSMSSYKDSKAQTRPGANRHGFKRNPKQDSPGRMTSDPFPKPKGWTAG